MSTTISQAKIKVMIYKSKVLANGEHPIVIRLSKHGKRTYKYLGISCKADEWDEGERLPIRKHPQRSSYAKLINKKLGEYSEEQAVFQAQSKEFTTHSLINAVEKPQRKVTVFDFFQEIISNLKEKKKLGYSTSIKDTLSSIKKFTNSKDIAFHNLDYKFLVDYETFLAKRRVKESTMAVYFRNIRKVYNEAIRQEIIAEIHYPFKKYKISKFNLKTKKRALKIEDYKRLESMDLPKGYYYDFSMKILKFIFYGRGINFIDIAKLKWENYENGKISYERHKTGVPLRFKVRPEVLGVIHEYQDSSGYNKQDYIFPILNTKKHITEQQIENRIHKVLSKVNKTLKKIGKLAGFDLPLTTYVFRHTWATSMKKNKNERISIEAISQGLGHSSTKVTEIYLADFEDDELDELFDKAY